MRVLYFIEQPDGTSTELREGNFTGVGKSSNIMSDKDAVPLGLLRGVRLEDDPQHGKMARAETRSQTIHILVPWIFPGGPSLTVNNISATERLAKRLLANVVDTAG